MKITIATVLPILLLGLKSHALETGMDLSDMKNYFNQNIVLATQPVSPQDIDTYAVLFAEALASDDLSFATGFLKIVLANENLLLHDKTMEIGKNLCYDYLESFIVKEVTDTEFQYRWSGVCQCALTIAEKMDDYQSTHDLFMKMLQEYDTNPAHNSVERYIDILSNQGNEFDNMLVQLLRNRVNTQYKHLKHQEVILNQLIDAYQKIRDATRMKIRETRMRETRIRNR